MALPATAQTTNRMKVSDDKKKVFRQKLCHVTHRLRWVNFGRRSAVVIMTMLARTEMMLLWIVREILTLYTASLVCCLMDQNAKGKHAKAERGILLTTTEDQLYSRKNTHNVVRKSHFRFSAGADKSAPFSLAILCFQRAGAP